MQNLIINSQRTWDASPTLPVTLAEAKTQCRVDDAFTTDDAEITALITQCTKAIENRCNISIVMQTVVLVADLYTDYELPFGPVISILSVKSRTSEQGSGIPTYEDSTRLWQIEGNRFLLGGWGDCGCSVNTRAGWSEYRYQITYRAGMDVVPDDLKLAILNEIAFRYEHRGDEQGIGVSDGTKELIKPFISYAW